MGRKPSRNLNLPTHLRARVRGSTVYYFYDHGGTPRKETSLGTDYILAVQKWAEMHESSPAEKITVAWAISKYLASPQFDQVSLGTQADYRFALDKLIVKFGDAPMDQVKPSHVTLYIDHRRIRQQKQPIYTKALSKVTWRFRKLPSPKIF